MPAAAAPVLPVASPPSSLDVLSVGVAAGFGGALGAALGAAPLLWWASSSGGQPDWSWFAAFVAAPTLAALFAGLLALAPRTGADGGDVLAVMACTGVGLAGLVLSPMLLLGALLCGPCTGSMGQVVGAAFGSALTQLPADAIVTPAAAGIGVVVVGGIALAIVPLQPNMPRDAQMTAVAAAGALGGALGGAAGALVRTHYWP